MCRHIAFTVIRNFANLHLKNTKTSSEIIYVNLLFFFLFFISLKTALCMPVIPFPSERVFNSATFMRGHIVLSTNIIFSNLHLKNCSG